MTNQELNQLAGDYIYKEQCLADQEEVTLLDAETAYRAGALMMLQRVSDALNEGQDLHEVFSELI